MESISFMRSIKVVIVARLRCCSVEILATTLFKVFEPYDFSETATIMLPNSIPRHAQPGCLDAGIIATPT